VRHGGNPTPDLPFVDQHDEVAEIAIAQRSDSERTGFYDDAERSG
jgi:hypothetical protein